MGVQTKIVREAGVFIALAASLFFFLPCSGDPFGVPKLLASGFICFLICLSLGFNGWRDKGGLWTPIILFLSANVLSWFFSVDKDMGLNGAFGQPYFVLPILFQCAVIFACDISFERLCDFSAACLIAEAVFCAANLAGYPSWATMSHRAVGTIGNPVFLAGWLAVAAPLACKSKWKWPGIAAALFLIFATRSRGPLFSAGLSALLFSRWKKYAWLALILIPISSLGPKRQSDFERAGTYKIAVRAGWLHPIFGWGPDTFSIANREIKTASDIVGLQAANDAQQSAHNDLLQFWATLGMVGIIAYCFLLFRIWLVLPKLDSIAAIALLSLFIQAKVNPIPNAGFLWAAAILSCAG